MHYFVFSYGGTGSTMLANFLSRYGKCFHLHDDSPPPFLTNKTTGPVHGPTNAKDVLLLRDKRYFLDPSNCRVIYIYRDPDVAKISRPSSAHFSHMNSCPQTLDKHEEMVKNSPYFDLVGENFSRKDAIIQAYSENGVDLNGYETHFDNWTKMPWDKEYDILLLNYSDLWDSLDTLFDFCKIPLAHISTFPKKKETWNKKNVSLDTRRKLQQIYKRLQEKIDGSQSPRIFSGKKRAQL